MELYFYTSRLDVAATSLADLTSLITALADESDPTNAATIDNVTGKIPPLVQSDTGEPLTLKFYDDASTPAAWAADSGVSLAIGLGYQDANQSYVFTSTATTEIVSTYRTATLALNTARLQSELSKWLGMSGSNSRCRPRFYLHLRKTTSGVSETVALLPVQVLPGVLSNPVVDQEAVQYITNAELTAAIAAFAADPAENSSLSASAWRSAISAASTGTLFADITNALNFACWGDSLTAGSGGTPYPTRFATATGYAAYNGGVGGETSTQIKTRFLADTARRGYNVIIWAGRNNYSDLATVLDDVATMVVALGHDRYIVMGVINGSYGGYEIPGGAGYIAIQALNSALSTAYGARYFDIREYLVIDALAAVGISPTEQDLIDIANDTPPTSLRSDALHLNTSGYQAVAIAVASRLDVIIGSDENALTPSNVLSLFRAPPPIGGKVRNTGAFSSVAVGSVSAFQSGVTLGVRSSFEVKEGLIYISNADGSAVGSMFLSGNGLGFHFDKALYPSTTNTKDIGAASLRFKDVWLNGEIYSTAGLRLANTTGGVYYGNQSIKCGPGTPEGVVSAPVGSLWLRTNGGAGSTFYVKESGTGNTGWVAK